MNKLHALTQLLPEISALWYTVLSVFAELRKQVIVYFHSKLFLYVPFRKIPENSTPIRVQTSYLVSGQVTLLKPFNHA